MRFRGLLPTRQLCVIRDDIFDDLRFLVSFDEIYAILNLLYADCTRAKDVNEKWDFSKDTKQKPFATKSS